MYYTERMRKKPRLVRLQHCPQLFCSLFVVALCVFSLYRQDPIVGAQISISPSAAQRAVLSLSTTRIDCATKPCIALTFDDGPSSQITPRILDILQQHQAHATFFVIGSRVAGHEQLLQRMQHEGHEIGNHSWDHPDFTKLAPDQIQDQVARAQAAISAAGVPAPQLFRPPYGAMNPMVRNQLPLPIILWNIDPEDWRATDPAAVIADVVGHAKPGAIVELHDVHQVTAAALPALLDQLQATYQFVTISQLFGFTGNQQGLYYDRYSTPVR